MTIGYDMIYLLCLKSLVKGGYYVTVNRLKHKTFTETKNINQTSVSNIQDP